METLSLLIALQIFFLIYQWIHFKNMKSSIDKAQNKALAIARKNEILLHSIHLSLEREKNEPNFPFPLKGLPFSDDSGIVLSVKKIKIPMIGSPFNASIGSVDGGYLLFFRYDTPTLQEDRISFNSNIGCISLDRDFEFLEEKETRIETGSLFSEDPRFFQNGKNHFLIFNDLINRRNDLRSIRIGLIDLATKKLKYTTTLNICSEKTEKNWTPFSCHGEIHFLYTIDPQRVFILPDPQNNLLSTVSLLPSSNVDWIQKWGNLRGGTPAIMVDGEYLSFFHSSFEDQKGVIWYVMGAYIFSSSNPFKITRISPCPILFKGLYDTVHEAGTNPKIRSIYPAGLVLDQRNGRELIHVSCGENDSGIKIVTMDKKALISSLRHLD